MRFVITLLLVLCISSGLFAYTIPLTISSSGKYITTLDLCSPHTPLQTDSPAMVEMVSSSYIPVFTGYSIMFNVGFNYSFYPSEEEKPPRL